MSKKKNNYYEFKNIAPNEYELYLYGEVSSWDEDINASGFKAALDEVPDGATITAYINSVGGSVFEGVAISSMIKRKKGTKKCIIDGLCASIATTIACAFDTVEMYSNSMYMIHCASSYTYGNAKELEQQIEALKKIDTTIVDTYKERTGLEEDVIRDYMEKETWFTAKEALELGFIDNIIEAKSQKVACADKNFLNKYKNVPETLLVEDKVDLEAENKINDELELLALEIELA